MTNKEKYRVFCEQEKSILIFSQAWWLDCVCGENNWDVAVVEKGGCIVATMPYQKTKKKIFSIISMPKLTQVMGPFIKYPKQQKYYKKISLQKEVMYDLIEKLPKVDYFSQNFDFKITNWLPFFWKGYSQTTNYTYRIENITIEDLEANLQTDVRRRRRKADKAGVCVVESDDIDKFYQLNSMTFERQNMDIPYSIDFVRNLYKKCKHHNSCKMIFAKNESDEIIAASFLVFDDNTVYYLMGGIDPEYLNLGGMDAVQWEGIKFALSTGRAFDFEGSMIETIEKYFRSFGSFQTPYFNIYKENSKILKVRRFIKDFF